MSTAETPSCPVSLRQIVGQDPYPIYEEMRARGNVIWDAGMQAWLVLSADGCREMMRTDLDAIRFWTKDLGEIARDIQGSSSLTLMEGEDHRRLHTWWLQQYSIPAMERFRVSSVRPLVNSLIDRFIEHGHVDLIPEYANRLPIRAIATVMGLPWRDDAWIDEVYETMKPIETFFNFSMAGDAEIIANARVAGRKLGDLLLPFVEERRNGLGDDIISRMWREVPKLIPGWDLPNILTNLRHMLFAGSGTTSHALASTLYLMMTEPGLIDQLKANGEKAIRALVEESLRLHGPVHYRSRRANRDFTLAGTDILRDQAVISVQSAANRDPQRYECPARLDLGRTNPRDHIAFNFGPRTCVGANLARLEVQETIRAFLDRVEDLRLDPDAPPPRFGGLQLRDFRPLHALFTPGPSLCGPQLNDQFR